MAAAGDYARGNFLPGLRHWVAIAAGITRFPLAGFARFAYLGVLPVPGLYFVGVFGGQEAGHLVERIGAPCRWATGLIAALFAASRCRFYCRFWMPLLVAVWQSKITARYNIGQEIGQWRGMGTRRVKVMGQGNRQVQ